MKKNQTIFVAILSYKVHMLEVYWFKEHNVALRFSAIRDQHNAIEILKRAIRAEKLHHAYLFEGPPGVGKALVANALIMALNCDQKNEEEACFQCLNCKKIIKSIHPDVRLLTLPEGKKRISIEAVREAERWISIGPYEGRVKVLVIDPADLMTDAAANALLKTLEEPRAGSYLILITSMPSSLLPTVRSRCQSVRFRALEDNTVISLLESKGISAKDASVVAALCDGSMVKAAEYYGEEFAVRIDAVLALMKGALSQTPEDALSIAATLRGDREETLAVLELFLLVLGEWLWLRSGNSVRFDESPLIKRLGQSFEALAANHTVQSITRHIAAANRAMVGIKQNNMNPQFAIEAMLMAMRGRREIGKSWFRIGAR